MTRSVMAKNKKVVKRIKDLPEDMDLRGVRFRHHQTGETVIWHSQWAGGVWYKVVESLETVHPLFLDNINDALEFEVVD